MYDILSMKVVKTREDLASVARQHLLVAECTEFVNELPKRALRHVLHVDEDLRLFPQEAGVVILHYVRVLKPAEHTNLIEDRFALLTLLLGDFFGEHRYSLDNDELMVLLSESQKHLSLHSLSQLLANLDIIE